MFQRAVFGLVKPFLLEQTWNKPGTKPTQTIVYLMNNMNKLFLACGRIGLSPVGIAFVPAVLFQGRFPKQGGAGGQNPLHLYPESGQKLHANMQPRAKKKRGNFPAFFVRFFGQAGLVRDWPA